MSAEAWIFTTFLPPPALLQSPPPLWPISTTYRKEMIVINGGRLPGLAGLGLINKAAGACGAKKTWHFGKCFGQTKVTMDAMMKWKKTGSLWVLLPTGRPLQWGGPQTCFVLYSRVRYDNNTFCQNSVRLCKIGGNGCCWRFHEKNSNTLPKNGGTTL